MDRTCYHKAFLLNKLAIHPSYSICTVIPRTPQSADGTLVITGNDRPIDTVFLMCYTKVYRSSAPMTPAEENALIALNKLTCPHHNWMQRYLHRFTRIYIFLPCILQFPIYPSASDHPGKNNPYDLLPILFWRKGTIHPSLVSIDHNLIPNWTKG